jgi:hypothetical protein
VFSVAQEFQGEYTLFIEVVAAINRYALASAFTARQNLRKGSASASLKTI